MMSRNVIAVVAVAVLLLLLSATFLFGVSVGMLTDDVDRYTRDPLPTLMPLAGPTSECMPYFLGERPVPVECYAWEPSPTPASEGP